MKSDMYDDSFDYAKFRDESDRAAIKFYLLLFFPAWLVWCWWVGKLDYGLGLVTWGATWISIMMGAGGGLICSYMASHGIKCPARYRIYSLLIVPGCAGVLLLKTEVAWLGNWTSDTSAHYAIFAGIFGAVINGGIGIYFLRYGQLPNVTRRSPNRLVAWYWWLTRAYSERKGERLAKGKVRCQCPDAIVVTDSRQFERMLQDDHLQTLFAAEDHDVEAAIKEKGRPDARLRERPRFKRMVETIGEEETFRLFEQYRRGTLYYCPVNRCLWKCYIPDDDSDFTDLRMERVSAEEVQGQFGPYW